MDSNWVGLNEGECGQASTSTKGFKAFIRGMATSALYNEIVRWIVLKNEWGIESTEKTYVLSDVLISKEKAGAEILLRYCIPIDDNETSYTGQGDIFESFCGHTFHPYNENSSIPHSMFN
jgi:hypothetical protein